MAKEVMVVVIDKSHQYYGHVARVAFIRQDGKYTVEILEVNGETLGHFTIPPTDLMTVLEYNQARKLQEK